MKVFSTLTIRRELVLIQVNGENVILPSNLIFARSLPLQKCPARSILKDFVLPALAHLKASLLFWGIMSLPLCRHTIPINYDSLKYSRQERATAKRF